MRGLDERNHLLHAAEVLRAGDLEVEDVDRQLRALADGENLLDPLAQLGAVVAQVRGVQAAHRAGRRRQRDELLEARIRVGRIDEAGRHAERALPHRRGDDRLHRR